MQQIIIEEKRKQLLLRKKELIERLRRIDNIIASLRGEKDLIISEIVKINNKLMDLEVDKMITEYLKNGDNDV